MILIQERLYACFGEGSSHQVIRPYLPALKESCCEGTVCGAAVGIHKHRPLICWRSVVDDVDCVTVYIQYNAIYMSYVQRSVWSDVR
jgi:hypothetical protein